jgi:hypothetical protein
MPKRITVKPMTAMMTRLRMRCVELRGWKS